MILCVSYLKNSHKVINNHGVNGNLIWSIYFESSSKHPSAGTKSKSVIKVSKLKGGSTIRICNMTTGAIAGEKQSTAFTLPFKRRSFQNEIIGCTSISHIKMMSFISCGGNLIWHINCLMSFSRLKHVCKQSHARMGTLLGVKLKSCTVLIFYDCRKIFISPRICG